MLRALRIALAVLCFTGFNLLFLDVSGFFPQKLAFLATMQLVPALLSGSFLVAAALAACTLLFGRIYCSTLCPLGVLQDMLSRLGRKQRFRFSRNRPRLRAGALLVFLLAFLAGASLIFSIFEPYSAFGRIATNLLAPVWQAGNNILALASERAGNFAVGPTPVWQRGLASLAIAVVTLGVISVLAVRSGRTWCNTLCPVGACLGFLHCFALLRPRIDLKKCARCGLCAQSCKSSCIDAASMVMDSSRCVTCFNCLTHCRSRAISYAPSWRRGVHTARESAGPDPARRAFIAAGLGIAAFPAVAAARNPDDRPPDLTRKKRPIRETPITPPGSSGLRIFMEHCTGCQLCVSSCPNQVLSAADRGSAMLQPAMSFERGFCRVNCTACSLVCPTGAIRPITKAQRSVIQIGRATADRERCIVTTDKAPCTACSRACPTGAAVLVGRTDGPRWLAVDHERCIGCGACEYVCPVRPLAAIRVEGNLEHRRV
ncbi:MAG: 4Fe-4S binding protein [Deltaproteobacteria bacterium]|jgi:ferredoxin|nr:4Fe-4S binding protein [Deltaproteobacteria bacterium]